MNSPPGGRGTSPVSPTFRAALASDAAAVAHVILESRERFLPWAPMVHSPDAVRAWVSGSLLPTGRVTVATGADGAVVGVLATSCSAGITWIDQLYVLPSHVGRGIGSSLLQRTLQATVRPVRLHTFQANVKARRFYERHGFIALSFTDGRENEERCPAVLLERRG